LYVMINNQRGTALPLVLVISFLLIFLTVHQLSLYVSEAKLYKEVESFYEVNHLLESGVVEAVSLIRTAEEPHLLANIQSTYPNGQIVYTFEKMSDEIGSVIIECQTSSNRYYKGQAYFQYEDGKVIQWIEYR
jgi:hypothetical protein